MSKTTISESNVIVDLNELIELQADINEIFTALGDKGIPIRAAIHLQEAKESIDHIVAESQLINK